MLVRYTGPKLCPLPGVVFGKARIGLQIAREMVTNLIVHGFDCELVGSHGGH
jgi:hypothetical protein